MLIFEVVCRDYDAGYVLFRTKNSKKAETFCNVYNKYHTAIFDSAAIIKVIDTARIEKDAEEMIKSFEFKTEVRVNKDGEVLSKKPVYINEKRIQAANLGASLSDTIKLYFDIKKDVTDAMIKSAYEKAVKLIDTENNPVDTNLVGVNC